MKDSFAPKSKRKTLSKLKIKMTCSQFTRIFLIEEAKLFHRSLNLHINCVLKRYFEGKTKKHYQSKLSIEIVKAIFSYQHQDTQINIQLFENLLDLFPHQDTQAISKEIKTAISSYLLAVLSDNSEETKSSRNIAKETLKNLVEWQKELQAFDELEKELEANKKRDQEHPYE